MATSLFEGCVSATVGRASLRARLKSTEPFFEILTSGPLTLYSPNLIMTWTRRRRVLEGLVGSEVEKMELPGGAPHSGFSRLIRRISARISQSILGRPTTWRGFQRQQARKPRRCQRSTVSGWTMMIASRSDGYSQYSHTNSKRSMFHSLTRVGDLRRRTTSRAAAAIYPDFYLRAMYRNQAPAPPKSPPWSSLVRV
jgi:hypothetical protein